MPCCRSCGRFRIAALLMLVCWLTGCCMLPTFGRAAEQVLQIEVDARDLPRRLLHTRLRIACEPGPLTLWYPKWIPGTHAPCGPVDTVGGLRLTTDEGKVIQWNRDLVELYRLNCVVPAGTHTIHVQLDTICNAPAVDASGHLSFGNGSVGIINWPTCLLYAAGPTARQTLVHLSLRLPDRWKYATALKPSEEKAGLIRFQPVSLSTLADSPLIAGEYMRTVPLAAGPNPPAFFHLASEAPAALQLTPEVVELYSRMVREAGALFGTCHYSEFHFLITCSDELGQLGLEHLSSSLNGVRERDLIDGANRKGWIANLIPHEYVHSWCGKFRRPIGQCTADFHTPERTSLLWVYEGLTEYLGEVIMVRSGLVNQKDYRDTLTSTIGGLMLRAGRKWRSLEDTAVASHLLRAVSPNWNELHRDQDYYSEGAFLWMEADAVIRQRTDGARSLDDFCRKFLGQNSSGDDAVPYDFNEIVQHLRATADFDWERFLTERINRPLDALPLDLVGRIGYRLQYAKSPSNQEGDRARGGISAQHSLGLTFSGDGHIINIVPGMAGDKAQLAPGMRVMGINGRFFSPRRLQDALADSIALRKIELLVLEGDRFRTIVLDYADGPRHLVLIRDESKPDLLAQILKPIADRPRSDVGQPLPKGYVAYRAAGPITIDGKIDEKDWQAAPWTDAFVDIEGSLKPLPRYQTRAKMLWDDQYFYVAAQLQEPHVWGTLTKHDAVIFQDNDFEIFIDPDGDNHEYYEIEINALNTEWDLFLAKPYRDGGPAVDAWEIPGLKTAVHVQGTLNDARDKDQFWSVEFAFPWKVLAEHAHCPALLAMATTGVSTFLASSGSTS